MRNLLILSILVWGLVVVPTSAFTQIQWADRFIVPDGGPASGGFYGGDGDQSFPGEWIDWCIGNYFPGNGLVTDDMIFSTNVGNFMDPDDWYERMRITKDGKVGIGTAAANPVYMLEVIDGVSGFLGYFYKVVDHSKLTTRLIRPINSSIIPLLSLPI